MVTNARKTDAQRLGNGKKAFNVKQIEKITAESDARITALETADAQNVKLSGNQTIAGDKTLTGVLKAQGQPAYSAEEATDDVATVGTLDGYIPMVRTTGNQDIDGQKVFDRNVYNSTTIATATSDWRCIAKMPASTSGTSVILMVAGHGSAIFNLIHYQCRNHIVHGVSMATSGDYSGKIAFVGDGTNEYMFISSASNHEIYAIGGNKSVPLIYTELPTETYTTVEALTAAYTTTVVI